MLALFPAVGGGFQGLQCSQKFSVLHGESGWPFFALALFNVQMLVTCCVVVLYVLNVLLAATTSTHQPVCSVRHHTINAANALWDLILQIAGACCGV